MRLLVAPILLIATAALVYSNSLSNPFVFDDLPAIVGNHDIRQIWPPAWLDSSWHGSLSSRPVVMFSLALSYAADGADSFSFRLANLILHIGCGLLVYAVVHQLLHSLPLSGPASAPTHPASRWPVLSSGCCIPCKANASTTSSNAAKSLWRSAPSPRFTQRNAVYAAALGGQHWPS